MSEIVFTKKLPVKKEYDVIVCGGGVAGVSAAVSAAKRGKSCLLVEKSTILGGLATLGLINLFVPMCNGNGKQIIFGCCGSGYQSFAVAFRERGRNDSFPRRIRTRG